ncbi:MAG: hypothetical protein HFI77_10630 [Lachnospiraceae bacterium]|nr:hypothetical protein [Lachnospiraceae bacterium]
MNKEKYSDPTADKAIWNVIQEKKKAKRKRGGRHGPEPEREGRTGKEIIQ